MLKGKSVLMALGLCFVAMTIFADNALWSEGFKFDGKAITEKAVDVRSSDPIGFSTAVVSGKPKSLTIYVEDTANSNLTACIFEDYSGEAVEGTVNWDYKDEKYKDFPIDDTYLMTETVTSDIESKVFTRFITLTPEPACLLIFGIVGALFLRKRFNGGIALLALALLTAASLRAETSVTKVECFQLWPMDRDVVINYTIDSDKADANFMINLFGTINKGKSTFFLKDKGILSGEGAEGIVAGSGEHKIIWTPNDSFYRTSVSDMKIRVEAIEAGPDTYMVIDLSGGTNATNFAVTYLDRVPEGGWTEEYKTTKLVLRKIQPGKFIMGSPEDELGREYTAIFETQHEVTLTKPFYAGVFEVTQKQYELVTGNNPSEFKGEDRPVECVSYDMIRGEKDGSEWPVNNKVDETSFMGILRSKTNLAFDLPTEAQWEFACRAGTTTALNNGDNLSHSCYCVNLDKLGRNKDNTDDGKGGYSEHTTVGSYIPNAWGLYDMHGNVNEWVLDWALIDDGNYDSRSSDPVTDPKGRYNGQYRMLRGGSWLDVAYGHRSGTIGSTHYSNRALNYYGFRVFVHSEKITQTFEYSINSDTSNTLPIFAVKFYGKLKNGTEYLLEEIGKISGDGAEGIVIGTGTRQLVWESDQTHINLADLELVVKYEDVTTNAKYLVLDLNNYKMRTALKGPMEDANIWSNDTCRTTELWLRRIEPGTFKMGSPENELGRYEDETQHNVTLTKAFYIGVFEMTQAQYEIITQTNPGVYLGETRPAENVSYIMLRGNQKGASWPANREVDDYYFDVYSEDTFPTFFYELREKTGKIFDLPTEAQWEYACRAGKTTSWNDGTSITNVISDGNLDKLGRYLFNGGAKDENSDVYGAHATVGSYLPNALGLYDMHGNVDEWCLDWYGEYSSDPVTDPKGAIEGEDRVLRGGSWDYPAGYCRSASRGGYSPYFPGNFGELFNGFRVVLVQE